MTQLYQGECIVIKHSKLELSVFAHIVIWEEHVYVSQSNSELINLLGVKEIFEDEMFGSKQMFHLCMTNIDDKTLNKFLDNWGLSIEPNAHQMCDDSVAEYIDKLTQQPKIKVELILADNKKISEVRDIRDKQDMEFPKVPNFSSVICDESCDKLNKVEMLTKQISNLNNNLRELQAESKLDKIQIRNLESENKKYARDLIISVRKLKQQDKEIIDYQKQLIKLLQEKINLIPPITETN